MKTPWQDATEATIRILFGIALVAIVFGIVLGEYVVVCIRWMRGE